MNIKLPAHISNSLNMLDNCHMVASIPIPLNDPVKRLLFEEFEDPDIEEYMDENLKILADKSIYFIINEFWQIIIVFLSDIFVFILGKLITT